MHIFSIIEYFYNRFFQLFPQKHLVFIRRH